jgi:type IV secretory pathway VirB3-like protein
MYISTSVRCCMIFASITKIDSLVLRITIKMRGLLIMEIVFNILIFYSIIVAILLLGVLLILYTTSDEFYADILARRDFQKKCPKCQGIWYDRIYRKSWMRLIPGTKLYYCNSCRYKFMIILRRSALRMAYRKSSPLSHSNRGILFPKRSQSSFEQSN